MSFNSGVPGAGVGAGEEKNIFIPEAEKKVLVNVRRHENTLVGTFVITDEDHTVGQLLRHRLDKDPRVVTAGYLIPHPLEPIMRVHVQTKLACTPQKAIVDAIDQSIVALNHLKLCVPK